MFYAMAKNFMKSPTYQANWNEILEWLKRSQESLKTAQLNFGKGLYAPAISRAYYVAFYAAHAAILTQDMPGTLKTHSGVHSLFSQKLIKTRRLPTQLARDLEALFAIRQKADYDIETTLRYRDADETLEKAERFLNTITQFINAQKPEVED